ncbi:hypothetical protein HanHA300_Chr14g0540591 [Helianthus annuus]|nr:hypothetical protein HanHA300_Chr14g0540591 [Helianthus annuus]KAJ0487248.1 hypothetical protein HanHA89_Chr14g0588361 [Helianthus annuus]KAJ0661361.1 hypothetical protein HanOQP8_Chr14g0547731 [Helianthus annuus]
MLSSKLYSEMDMSASLLNFLLQQSIKILSYKWLQYNRGFGSFNSKKVRIQRRRWHMGGGHGWWSSK